MSDVREGFEVRYIEAGIADRFDEDQASVVIDGSPHLVQVVDVYELRGHPQLRERVSEQIVGAAVEGLGGNQIVPGTSDVEDGESGGGLPAGDRQSRHASFELRNPLLEDIAGRIHDPGIDISEYPETKQISGVLAVVEDVAGGGVNRNGPRIGGGIDRLAGVDGDGVWLVRHRLLLSVEKENGPDH